MKKILITGAAGFIGSHVAEKLATLGHEVVGVDNFSSFYNPKIKYTNAQLLVAKKVNMIQMDLRDPESFQNLQNDFSFIFHFAAQPGLSSKVVFEDYVSNNVTATENLLKFAATCPSLKLFINISTSSVYGAYAFLNEEAIPQPVSNYGTTKLAAEQLVLQKSRTDFFSSCSLRLYSVIGPRERPDKMFSRLIYSAFNQIPFPLYEGSIDHKRSFSNVFDISEGIIECINKYKILDGEIINLGSQHEYTTLQGIETVEQLLNTKIKTDILPKRTGDQLHTKAQIQKAQKILNFNPLFSLQDSITQQINWYSKYKFLLKYQTDTIPKN